MNKLKLFIENFIVYGVGGIISKIVPLIMVPIITRLMPDTMYFGLSDLSNTVVSFASAIAVMGMYDAMYRLFFENEDMEYKKSICSTTVAFTIGTSLIVFIVMLLLKDIIAQYFFRDIKYGYLVYLSAMAALVSATNSIVSAPTRMQNKRRIFLITNTVGPLLAYAIVIPLLMHGHYVIALPLANVISGVVMELSFAIMNREWFSIRKINWNNLKPLLVIALPLLPNFLIYWLFNACDKIMIANMLDVGAAGIYSVGSKLGQCSQLIYIAFTGGWQFFAFSTMKEKNQVQSNSSIFEYLGIISFIATAFICAWSYWIFKILFTEEYLQGYVIAPYLFMAPLLQMLFQVACNQFVIIRRTWPNMLILLGGAIVNLVLNYLLIPILGIEGASIATLFGYIISDIICVIVLCKMGLMVISKRFLYAISVMVIFLILWRCVYSSNGICGTISAIILAIIIICIYRQEIFKIINVIRNKNKI